MNKFKMPSTKSYLDHLASRVSAGKGNKDALTAVDYSLAHPSSLEEAREQAQRAIRERDAIAKKTRR